MTDKNYKGDDFLVDKDIANGPLTNRKCTDVFCCLFFVGYLVLLGLITDYSWKHSEKAKLLAPIDADGKLCGVDFPEYD